MERIGKDVERALSRSGSGQVLALSHITSAWPGAVGDAVARQAWPLRLGRDGALRRDDLRDLGLRAGPPSPRRSTAAWLPCSAARRSRSASASARSPSRARSRRPRTLRRRRRSRETSARPSAASAIDDPELRELVSRAARRAPGTPSADGQPLASSPIVGGPEGARFEALRGARPPFGASVRPWFLIEFHCPAIWRFAGLF